jgi:hypothetical protein
MSGEEEPVDERALSLEEVFLSREFGHAHPVEPVVDEQVVDQPDPAEEVEAPEHGRTTHRRRPRAAGGAGGLAAALIVALGLVTGTGKATPEKAGGPSADPAAQAARSVAPHPTAHLPARSAKP